MANSDELKFRDREEALATQWTDKNDLIPVNNQQYSFDTPERQQQFDMACCGSEKDYKIFQEYRAEWYRRAKEFNPGDAPLAVCCELVSACNLNCPMCYTITEEFQASVIGAQRILPWNTVKAIIDECVDIGVYSMLFSWRGESTLYKSKDDNGQIIDFADVLAYARKKGILEITSLTNGSVMDEKMARKIIEAQPNWISVSVDGMGEIYNKIRTPVTKRGTDFNAYSKVAENIKQFVTIRDSLGLSRPQIRTNTIYPPISGNPKAYHDTMVELGVDWVTVNELMDMRGEEIPDSEIKEYWACQYPFQRLTISSNGLVVPCTGAHNEEDKLVLGRYPGSKIKKVTRDGKEIRMEHPERTLHEIWTSPKLKAIRDAHKTNNRKSIHTCKFCRHGAVKHGVEWIPDDWDMETQEWKGGVWID